MIQPSLNQIYQCIETREWIPLLIFGSQQNGCLFQLQRKQKTTFQTKFLDLHHKKYMYVPNSKENVTFRSCVRNFSKRVWELYLQMLQLVGKQIAWPSRPRFLVPTKIKSWNWSRFIARFDSWIFFGPLSSAWPWLSCVVKYGKVKLTKRKATS